MSSWSWGCWATWRSSPLWAPWQRTCYCRPTPSPPSSSSSPRSSSQVDQGLIQINICMRLLSGKAYLSDPIFCYRNTDDKFPKDMLTTYCYIHGTYTTSQEYPVSHFKGTFVHKSYMTCTQHQLTWPMNVHCSFIGMGSPRDNDNLLYHKYYQWVNLVLFLQACSFYLPRWMKRIDFISMLLYSFVRILWRNMEGMTIKHLTQDLSNPVIKDDERRKQLSRVVDYLTVSKVINKI